jgi:hypothetical protein
MLKPTVRAINELKPQRSPKRYYLDGGPVGFHVVVSPSGRKTWHLAYRVNGKRKFNKLGSYPAQTIDTARKLAWEAIGKLERGDPLVEAPAPVPEKGPTVRELRTEYLAHLERRGAKALKNATTVLMWALAPVELKPVREVTRADIIALLKPHWERGHLTYTEAMRVYIQAMFNWALTSESIVGGSSVADGAWSRTRRKA